MIFIDQSILVQIQEMNKILLRKLKIISMRELLHFDHVFERPQRLTIWGP